MQHDILVHVFNLPLVFIGDLDQNIPSCIGFAPDSDYGYGTVLVLVL